MQAESKVVTGSQHGMDMRGQLGQESPQRPDVLLQLPHLDVQRRVAQQFLPQRADRPVRGRMALLQVEAEYLFDQRAQGHPRVAEQPPGQLGVEQLPRPETDLGQARQVLGGRVQDGLRVPQGRVYPGQIRAGDGVDEHRACPAAAELDQVGALPVAVARGPFGIDGDRPVAAG